MNIILLFREIFARVSVRKETHPMNILLDYADLTSDMRAFADSIIKEIQRCPECDSTSFRPDGQAISPQGVVIKMFCGDCGVGHSTLTDPESFGLFMCDWSSCLMEIQNAATEVESCDDIVIESSDDSE